MTPAATTLTMVHSSLKFYFHDKVYINEKVFTLLPQQNFVHVHSTSTLLVYNIGKFFFSLLAEFYPIFQIIDLVTEEHTVYKEPYSLRAIAGGTGPTNMQYFNQSM